MESEFKLEASVQSSLGGNILSLEFFLFSHSKASDTNIGIIVKNSIESRIPFCF